MWPYACVCYGPIRVWERPIAGPTARLALVTLGCTTWEVSQLLLSLIPKQI